MIALLVRNFPYIVPGIAIECHAVINNVIEWEPAVNNGCYNITHLHNYSGDMILSSYPSEKCSTKFNVSIMNRLWILFKFKYAHRITKPVHCLAGYMAL